MGRGQHRPDRDGQDGRTLSSPQHCGGLQADPARGGRAGWGAWKVEALYACCIITYLAQEAMTSAVQMSFHDKGSNNTLSFVTASWRHHRMTMSHTPPFSGVHRRPVLCSKLSPTTSCPQDALSSQALSQWSSNRALPPGPHRPLTDEPDLPVALHVVEGGRYPGRLPVQHSKLTSVCPKRRQ